MQHAQKYSILLTNVVVSARFIQTNPCISQFKIISKLRNEVKNTIYLHAWLSCKLKQLLFHSITQFAWWKKQASQWHQSMQNWLWQNKENVSENEAETQPKFVIFVCYLTYQFNKSEQCKKRSLWWQCWW